MLRILQVSMLTILLSFTLQACAEQEKDPFAVTAENCGKLTLAECKKAMAWAKQYQQDTRAKTEATKKRIQKKHEEALNILAESQKQTN